MLCFCLRYPDSNFAGLSQASATMAGVALVSAGSYPGRDKSPGNLVLEICVSSECVRTAIFPRLLIGHSGADFPRDRKKA